MVREERWLEIRRLHLKEGRSVTAIARLMDLDRKTVRRCLKDKPWQPYRRRAKVDTLLTAHAEWIRSRAPEVAYSVPGAEVATRF